MTIARSTLADVAMRIDTNGNPMGGASQAALERAKEAIRVHTDEIIRQSRADFPGNVEKAKERALKLAIKLRNDVLRQKHDQRDRT